MKKILLLSILIFTVFTGLAGAHGGHEHASNMPNHVKWGLGGIEEIQNLHPVIVHFPIALLLAAALFYVLGAISKKEQFYFSGKWLLYFGTVAAAVAVWTGLHAADTVNHDEESHLIMMPHQYLGIGILVLGAIFSLWATFSKNNVPRYKAIFIVGMILLSGVIAQQADLGGRLVYLKGVGVGKKSIQTENQVVEKWEAIESQQAKLKATVAARKLEEVHEIAFSIRDLVKELPGETLTSDQKITLNALTQEVQTEAGLLDESGDAGDLSQTQEQFKKFNQTLLSIKKLYGGDN